MQFRKKMSMILGLSAVALAVLFLSAPAVEAQQSLTVSNFNANPTQLLTQNPSGGAQLVSAIRNVAVSDETALSAILNLLSAANKDQKIGIAAGLAQAAKVVLKANPAYANEIQQAIAKTKDQELVLAFTAASGDQATGSTGAGGGAPGGASGGQTTGLSGPGGGGGPAQPIGQPGVNTGLFTMSSSVTGVSSSVSP